MAEKKQASAKPIETEEELLQKAFIHTPVSAQTTAQKASAVSRVQERPVSTFVAQGNNPYAEEELYQIMREIYLPLPRPGQSPNATVNLNDVTWKIPRGKRVTLPLPVYEQFQRIQKAEVAEMKLHAKMAASLGPENFGMGYRLGEEKI